MSGITQHLLPYILFSFFTAFARVQDDVELQKDKSSFIVCSVFFSIWRRGVKCAIEKMHRSHCQEGRQHVLLLSISKLSGSERIVG